MEPNKRKFEELDDVALEQVKKDAETELKRRKGVKLMLTELEGMSKKRWKCYVYDEFGLRFGQPDLHQVPKDWVVLKPLVIAEEFTPHRFMIKEIQYVGMSKYALDEMGIKPGNYLHHTSVSQMPSNPTPTMLYLLRQYPEFAAPDIKLPAWSGYQPMTGQFMLAFRNKAMTEVTIYTLDAEPQRFNIKRMYEEWLKDPKFEETHNKKPNAPKIVHTAKLSLVNQENQRLTEEQVKEAFNAMAPWVGFNSDKMRFSF